MSKDNNNNNKKNFHNNNNENSYNESNKSNSTKTTVMLGNDSKNKDNDKAKRNGHNDDAIR